MKENSTWRNRYNNELHKQSKEPSISNIFKLKTLKCAVHIVRIDGKCKPGRILESNIIGRRPVGKPKEKLG
jgi:hypothetical protein